MRKRDFSFEWSRWWKAAREDLHLQTLLDRPQGFFRGPAESLQEDESEQDKGDMQDHGSIDTTLTGGQAAELLGIPEEGLNRPAAAFTKHKSGQIGVQVVGGQDFAVPVTVSGHDQPQMAILG